MNTRNSGTLPAARSGFTVLCLTLALAVSLVLSAAASAVAASSIRTEVVKGKSAVMTLPSAVTRVSVADPEVADVIVLSTREVQLIGKEIGSTSLIVWDKAGVKTFFDVDVVVDLKAMREQIGEIAPGDTVNYRFVNPTTLVLTGTVKTEERLIKIRNILLGFGQDITEKELYILQGGVVRETRNVGDKKGFKFVLLVEVTDPLQVLLQVTVASIDRNASRELGINWAVVRDGLTIDSAVSSVTGGLTRITDLGTEGVTSSVLTTEDISGATFGVVDFRNGVQYLLRALASKGLAKVLAEPNLLVKSGDVGKLLAGGELPIPIVSSLSGGGNTVTVTYKEFGVRLFFRPIVTEGGLIKLEIDPAEVSNVSGLEVQVEGITLPSFTTNRVSTSVDLREGESFVIAGLLNTDWNKALTKLPILGDLPILGAFFRTQTMEKNEHELVFIVTPKLMKPMAPGQRVELPGSAEPTKEQLDDLRWIPLLPTYRSNDSEQLQ